MANTNKSLAAMRPSSKQARVFTLPMFPRVPEEMMRRFPEWKAFQAEVDRWHQESQQQLRDQFESSRDGD